MNILFVVYLAFAAHTLSISKGLHNLTGDAEFGRNNFLSVMFGALSAITFPAAIIWAFMTLKWWEVILDFIFGTIFISPLLQLIINRIFVFPEEASLEKQFLFVMRQRRITDLIIISISVYMWLLYFGVLTSGPFSNRFS